MIAKPNHSDAHQNEAKYHASKHRHQSCKLLTHVTSIADMTRNDTATRIVGQTRYLIEHVPISMDVDKTQCSQFI